MALRHSPGVALTLVQPAGDPSPLADLSPADTLGDGL